MTSIRLNDGIVKDEILVVGLAIKAAKAGKSASSLQIESGDIALDTKALLQTLADLGATGKADEVIKVPGTATRLIVFTGLGKQSATYDNEVLRRAAGAASRELSGNTSATFSLPAKNENAVQAIAEGAGLGNYLFDQFRGSTKSAQKAPLKTITVHTSLAAKSAAKDAAKVAEVISTYTYLVRDLINTPPSHLTPESFCTAISAAVKKAGGAAAGRAPSGTGHAGLVQQLRGAVPAAGGVLRCGLPE